MSLDSVRVTNPSLCGWLVISLRIDRRGMGFAPGNPRGLMSMVSHTLLLWPQGAERFADYWHGTVQPVIALVAVTALLGLLGTVTGMVEVFDVMAVTGSSNARLMAAGISKATIPTMAGLVASLSGLIFINTFDRNVQKASHRISDDLLIE